MPLRLGVIADDFTGATDIAGFLVAGGLRTAQINGLPTEPLPDADAFVISLKSRSIEPREAVDLSLAAHAHLRAAGAERIFFKYCSTFDSSPRGNIGPVTDALMDAEGADLTVLVPALPVNGRTVYNGYLFVNGVPLHESGMRHHPITPMTDSNLMRVMQAQGRGTCGVLTAPTIDAGVDAVREALGEQRSAGARYVVVDTLRDAHLDTIGEAVRDLPLVTGGSGLGGALARALSGGTATGDAQWHHLPGRAVILSGSASEMTNAQVDQYQHRAPSLAVDVDRLVADPETYREEVLAWIVDQPAEPAPMVHATARPEQVRALQDKHGAEVASGAIEDMVGRLAVALRDKGFTRFIVAGGETSGAVTTALGVSGFHVGPQIAPGVPWVRALDDSVELALKSGNFGAPDFFSHAQNREVL